MWVTQISKKAFCPLLQKFLDLISRRAPGSVISVSWENVSPVIGVRCGSCFTLGHTRYSKQTNRSLILS